MIFTELKAKKILVSYLHGSGLKISEYILVDEPKEYFDKISRDITVKIEAGCRRT